VESRNLFELIQFKHSLSAPLDIDESNDEANGVICLYLRPSSLITGLLTSVLYRTQ
jgi:hypothetical protein